MNFAGTTYNPTLDETRLTTLFEDVRDHMLSHGEYRTYAEIHQAIKRGTEASISARLRDCRKPENGGYTVNGRRRGDPKRGLWEFQVLPPGMLL